MTALIDQEAPQANAAAFQTAARTCAALVSLMGMLVIVGWVSHNTSLKGLSVDGLNVKTNTGIGLFLGGLSLLLQSGDLKARAAIRAGRLCGMVVMLIGMLTLSEHVVGWNLHIDQFFFHEPIGAIGTTSPNRMGPPASICFGLTGASLLLLRADPLRRRLRKEVASLLAVMCILVALIPALGYLFGAPELFVVAKFTGIALPTSLSFIVLSVGILCALPASEIVSRIMSASPGGMLVRRLLLPAIFLPPLMGLLRNLGESAHLYDGPTGRALTVVTQILIFALLIFSSSYEVDAADEERRRAANSEARAMAAKTLSEARFQLLANTIPQLAWMARPDGTIFWYNDQWYKYTGTTAAQVEAYGWQSVHDPKELPRIMALWQASLASGEPWDDTFPLKRYDGEMRWHLSRANPLRDADGKISMWCGTNTDITEQRRVREEREQLLESERAARGAAERAGRLKDEFLATLSHELRTPLNAILGWAQVLRRKNHDDKDINDGLVIIERNSRVQARLIEDLLDMSRIISGKLRIDVQNVEIHDITQAAIEAVRPAAEAREIRIEAVLDAQVGRVRGDAARLQQVLWNLLSNAIKFTPKGGKVQVFLNQVNSHLEITVSDNGIGIAPEFLPYMFERFRQADGSTRRHYGGLGIGLALVKNLVELHGGHVRASSMGEGKDATFVVELPLSAVAQNVSISPPAVTSADKEFLCQEDLLKGVSVLVVDDDEDARKLISRVLQECKARVLSAASANEAMEILVHEHPAVLLSDIGMPDEDGYEFIQRVRALSGSGGGYTPAAALTAFARSEDRTRALRAGYQTHIAKPVEPAELVAVVASLAGRTGAAFPSDHSSNKKPESAT